MKNKFLLCALALMTSLLALAQDIIVTTDAKKIEAKILEVSKSEIKYKELDNLDGPTFIIEASEISSVIYSNGKVVLYNQSAQPEPQKAAEQPVLEQVAAQEENEVEELPDVPNYQTGRIYRDNGHYMYNNAYIESKEVARILERENSVAYDEWRSAKGLAVGGAVMLGIGAGLVGGGLGSLASGIYVPCIVMECVSLVPLSMAIGFFIGSSKKYNHAIDIYNSKFDNVAVQLRWGVSTNGLGLALAF